MGVVAPGHSDWIESLPQEQEQEGLTSEVPFIDEASGFIIGNVRTSEYNSFFHFRPGPGTRLYFKDVQQIPPNPQPIYVYEVVRFDCGGKVNGIDIDEHWFARGFRVICKLINTIQA